MDNAFPQAAEHRPAPAVLGALESSCRALLADRATFDDRYLTALGILLPDGHPLRQVPGAALDLLDVLMRAAVSGDPAEQIEAECQECGARCAAMGLPDDTFPAIGRAAARAAREVSGEAWTSAMSSGWAALHLWVVEHLTTGASRGRSRGHVWQSFPELAPPKPPPGQPWDESGPGGTATPGRSDSTAAEWALLEQAAGMTAPDLAPATPGTHAASAPDTYPDPEAYPGPAGYPSSGPYAGPGTFLDPAAGSDDDLDWDPRVAGDGRHGRRARREPGEAPAEPKGSHKPDPGMSWTP